MLKVDLYHNHPIVKAFVEILLEIQQETRNMYALPNDGPTDEGHMNGIGNLKKKAVFVFFSRIEKTRGLFLEELSFWLFKLAAREVNHLSRLFCRINRWDVPDIYRVLSLVTFK